MPRTNTLWWLCFDVLVKQVPVFVHAPTQASKNLEESIFVVAIPKLNKSIWGPKELQTYFFAFYPLQDLRKTYLYLFKPIIDPLLPKEQAGFWCRKLTVDQVTPLTQEIEDNFLAKKKAAAMFVDLTTAYYTVSMYMLNHSELKKGKYMNKLRIVFKNQYFHEKSFDS